jgi:hypothetical protein
MSIHLGTNHRWANAKAQAKRVVTWDGPGRLTSSVSDRDPEVAAWLAAGNVPAAALPDDPGPPRVDVDDLQRRMAALEAKLAP